MPPDSPQFAPLYSLDEAGLKAQLTTALRRRGGKAHRGVRQRSTRCQPEQALLHGHGVSGGCDQAAERNSRRRSAGVQYSLPGKRPMKRGGAFSAYDRTSHLYSTIPKSSRTKSAMAPDLQPLADRVSGVWTPCAHGQARIRRSRRNGGLNNTDQRGTMIINDEWKVVNDPRQEVRLLMQSLKARLLVVAGTRTRLSAAKSSRISPQFSRHRRRLLFQMIDTHRVFRSDFLPHCRGSWLEQQHGGLPALRPEPCG